MISRSNEIRGLKEVHGIWQPDHSPTHHEHGGEYLHVHVPGRGGRGEKMPLKQHGKTMKLSNLMLSDVQG